MEWKSEIFMNYLRGTMIWITREPDHPWPDLMDLPQHHWCPVDPDSGGGNIYMDWTEITIFPQFHVFSNDILLSFSLLSVLRAFVFPFTISTFKRFHSRF